MIRQDIDIAGYWKLTVCYNVYLGQLNAGFTHTDFSKRRSIIGIGQADSKRQMLNTISHEAKHAQSHICKYYNVPEDGERAAYLLGYIMMNMYDYFRALL